MSLKQRKKLALDKNEKGQAKAKANMAESKIRNETLQTYVYYILEKPDLYAGCMIQYIRIRICASCIYFLNNQLVITHVITYVITHLIT